MGFKHSSLIDRPTSPEKGSIGEHLAPAHLIVALSGWPDKQSKLELFQIDRGTDIGIDFIVRISRKRYSTGRSILIAVQVKTTGKERFSSVKFSREHARLIRAFPGPSIIFGIKFRGSQEEILLRNYIDALEKSNKSKIDLEKTKWRMKRWNSPDGVKITRKFIKELCLDYTFKTSNIETDLARHDPHAADKKLKAAVKWFCAGQFPPQARLMMNRIQIRRARWDDDYKKVCSDLDKQNLPRGACPDYDGYCIHYQKALVRDEWTRSEKWARKNTPDHRSRLIEALGILTEGTSKHTSGSKKRLYRLGLGILAVLVVCDVLYQNDGQKVEWRQWWDKLEPLGPDLDELKQLGEIYRTFLKEMIHSSTPKPIKLLSHYRELDRRPPERDPDENVVLYLLTSIIHYQREEARQGYKYANMGCVICSTVKKPLWLAPVELARRQAKVILVGSQKGVEKEQVALSGLSSVC